MMGFYLILNKYLHIYYVINCQLFFSNANKIGNNVICFNRLLYVLYVIIYFNPSLIILLKF